MISKVYTANGLSFLASLDELKSIVDLEFGIFDFLFFVVHPDFEIDIINKEIKNRFETENFVAFHAVEHFNNYEIVEKGVSVCCLRFQKRGAVKTFYIEDVNEKNAIFATIDYLNRNRDKFHIVLAGICGGDMGAIVETISEKLDYTPVDNIVGGISSGVLERDELHTFEFIDDKIIKNGFVILSFENMEATVDVSLGFKPYGITYEVSKSQGYRLYTIDDDKDASYMVSKMLDNIPDDDIRNLWYTPLSFLSTKHGYTSKLRTVKGITDEYVEFFAPVKEGEYFKLSFATPEDLIAEDEKVSKKLIEKISNPELSFNFSCIARQYILEDMQDKELEAYMNSFKTNLFGFFTFGEIGPDKMYKKLNIYNETSLAVLMREK
jgi:hypothetical protein